MIRAMFKGRGRTSLLVALTLTSASFGLSCSSMPGQGAEAVDRTGSIGLELQLGGAVSLDRVTYTITGVGYTKVGQLDVSNSSQISGIIGGIPIGAYTIRLDAVSVTQPQVSCTGSAPFDVLANQTAYAPYTKEIELGAAGSLAW